MTGHGQGADFAGLLERLREVSRGVWAWGPDPVCIARAPGRLDVMGGIADYSGVLALQWPIAEATLVAVQRSAEPWVRVQSVPLPESDMQAEQGAVPRRAGQLPLAAVQQATISARELRTLCTSDRDSAWLAYVVGALWKLRTEWGETLSTGLNVLVASSVPEGKGVSSSAALEVATLRAVLGLFGKQADGPQLAAACQEIENQVAGAPCGLMDQMAVSCGQLDRLLPIVCQPASGGSRNRSEPPCEPANNRPVAAHCLPPVELPEGLSLWGIDSAVRHEVGGADYGAVRVAAFMGYRMLAERLGLAVEVLEEGRVSLSEGPYSGFLANVDPHTFEERWVRHLPEGMSGEHFLQRYAGIHDQATSVDPARTYSVRAATAHPVYEQMRCRAFLDGCRRPSSRENFEAMGQLMYRSHRSYSRCGLGSPATDQLVKHCASLGSEAGIYGAKITGGGSGGTVAVLADQSSAQRIAAIASQYAEQSGRRPYVFHGSSPGAIACPVRWARRTDEGHWVPWTEPGTAQRSSKKGSS